MPGSKGFGSEEGLEKKESVIEIDPERKENHVHSAHKYLPARKFSPNSMPARNELNSRAC